MTTKVIIDENGYVIEWPDTPIEPIRKHAHYYKDVSKLKAVDVYMVCKLFGVNDAAISHAVKKLLCSGQRGYKDAEKDIREAIDTLERYIEIERELGGDDE